MKILWIIVLFGFLAAAVEAKRKRKFEGDFEFAEEVSGDPYYCSYINHVFAWFYCWYRNIFFCHDSKFDTWFRAILPSPITVKMKMSSLPLQGLWNIPWYCHIMFCGQDKIAMIGALNWSFKSLRFSFSWQNPVDFITLYIFVFLNCSQ